MWHTTCGMHTQSNCAHTVLNAWPSTELYCTNRQHTVMHSRCQNNQNKYIQSTDQTTHKNHQESYVAQFVEC